MSEAVGVERTERAERTLLEHEVYGLLESTGIEAPRSLLWRGEPGASLPPDVEAFLARLPSAEVVLKIASPDILHKTEAGGVAFASREGEAVLRSARKVWSETARLAPGARREGVLLVERLPVASGSLGAELLVSFKRDPAFGPVLVLGVGGLLTEWWGEATGGASTVVLSPGRVADGLSGALGRSPVLSLLFRGSRLFPEPPVALEDAVQRLEALARVAMADGAGGLALRELELNPVVVLPSGRWVALDGKGWRARLPVPPVARPIRKIEKLLRPRSAVVVGASATSLNPGRIILRNLRLSDGITYGRLWAVHPKEASIDGVPCVKSPEDLPEAVDMAVVAVPAEGARDAIRAFCRTGRAESIILIPGGFAETGRRELEDEIRGAVAASRTSPGGGPVLLGGNCLGVVSKRQYNTFFLPQYKLPFHDAPGDRLVAVSQSGAYLVSLTSNLDGIVFPKASISYGNQMDLTVADFLEFLEGDEEVRVVACYVEGFAPLDGARFVAAARRLREQGKRVLAFKAGKTALGAKATQSHTASLAGDYAVARALMEDAGVVVTATLDMFEDYTKVFTMLGDRQLHGRRVAIVSNAGFECSAVLDKLYDLVPAALADGTKARLASVLPAIAHADNPVDATPMATTSDFVAACEAMLADPGVDALLVSPIPVTPALDNLAPDLTGGHPENIHSPGSLPQELLRVFRATQKPLVVNVDSGRLYDDFVTVLQRGGIPVFRKIDRASRALSALLTR